MRLTGLHAIAIVVMLVAGCAARHESRPATARQEPRPPTVSESIAKGVDFLVKSQQPDGSWGTGLETRGLEIYSMVPGSHDAFRVATTALCVMALREAGERGRLGDGGVGRWGEKEKEAHERGVRYLVENGQARRDRGDLMYNIWANIYGLQALAYELKDRPDPKIKAAAEWHLDRLVRYETYMGGWNYYDFDIGTQSPAMGPTSFGTAAGLVALWDAKQAGIDVPQKLIDRGLRRLREMRLPNGAYLYSHDHQYIPRLPANMTRGSIGRNQPGNYALWIWDFGGIGQAESDAGLEEFFREHAYIDMGRKRPFPHDSWYQTAPYYYYFDHYYAARLACKLPEPAKERYLASLVDKVKTRQEPDGSWWDYAMWDYHKPYGTAFAVMTLVRCR